MPRLVPFRLVAACALALASRPLDSLRWPRPKGLAPTCAWSAAAARSLAEDTSRRRHDVGQDQPEGDLLRPGHRRQRQSGDDQRADRAGHADARRRSSTAALRPLLITDAFDFGLGICGVGSSAPTKKLSWYLKVNHENPELGGELVKLQSRRRSALGAGSVPVPGRAGAESRRTKRQPVEPFTVSVFSYDDKGKKTPAAGAKVTGATAPTGADGTHHVTLSKAATLTATPRHGHPVQRRSAVCVAGSVPTQADAD